MRVLAHPILHDVARIIERHPDLNPEYKMRLLQGLSDVDHQLEAALTPPEKPAKGAK